MIYAYLNVKYKYMYVHIHLGSYFFRYIQGYTLFICKFYLPTQLILFKMYFGKNAWLKW